MDIIEQLRQSSNFTNSEKTIIDLLFKNPEILNSNITAKELGNMAYTSASTVVRLCQKVGMDSYSEFKLQFLSSWNKRARASIFVDASIPFKASDSLEEVVEKITELETITLKHTKECINMHILEKAVRLLSEADIIDIYGHPNNTRLCEDFAQKMATIHKRVFVHTDESKMLYVSGSSISCNGVGIIISYSGQTNVALEVARELKQNNIKTISITGKSSNALVELTDMHLYMATLEKNKNQEKIGLISSNISISSIMNYLYAGVFSLDYDKNYNIILKDQVKKL